MTESSAHTHSPGSRFFPSVLLPAVVLGGLLVITLTIQVLLAWQAHQRLAPVNRHIAQMARLQGVNLDLQRELVESLRDMGSFTADERVRLHKELKAILEVQSQLSPESTRALINAHNVLADARREPKEALILALSHTRVAIDLETRAHQRLIEAVNQATVLEFQIGILTLVVFPSGAIVLLYLMRQRIFAPLNHLGFLMTLLGRRDYSPAPIAAIDPILRPLTENYNTMVNRLAAFEREHDSRERDLESQVHYATRALLEQQRSLANTERLAAVGETMARIAHELRNPLAGIKLACINLRQELDESQAAPDYLGRVDVIAAEIDRIISVLNSLLDQSRHNPEPLTDVVLAKAVADLVVLARYQIPAHIRFEQNIAADIVCRLPDALLRQALLNLLLNAQQAIDRQAGVIVIDAEVEDGLLHLRVCDDGPGFPEDLLQAGIRTFVTHRPEGTGLGLSMVQRFARAHGGRLHLANVEPHGACVTLDLPCGRKHG